MKIGNREFEPNGKTYIMGILNGTPDSFSDGGNFAQLESALKHVKEMIEDGADIIDVGGESTRPGYTPVSEAEEMKRVVPIIRGIKATYDIPVSIDTYKAKVAEAALAAGADMVNDIWGLKYDLEMARVIQRFQASVCIMHNRTEACYEDLIPDMLRDLEESLKIAEEAGIPKDKIILDPGIGFGKTYEMNLTCIGELDRFSRFGLPLLLGASRKSVVGLTLNLPVGEREEGTLATTVIAVMKGCQFVRVHNVRSNRRAVLMTEAIKNNGKSEE